LQQEIIKIGEYVYPHEDPGAATGTASTEYDED